MQDEPLRLIPADDPRLRTPATVVGQVNGSVKRLARRMETLMRTERGCGLAAPQVGHSPRLFVFMQEGGAVRTVIDPEIVSAEGCQLSEEGCLSLSRGSTWTVERAERIIATFQNEKGRQVQMVLTGADACVFQHEYDHLQGVLLPDHGELTHDQALLDKRRRENPSGAIAALALLGLAGGTR
jgi:peptide deformylase